ncbi:hypothetical protein D3C85_1705710 [compost metagenome]
MRKLAGAGAADLQDVTAERGSLAVGVEPHAIAGGHAVHLVLGNIGIHLPAARIDQHPQGFLTAHPLARLPVGIDVQP